MANNPLPGHHTPGRVRPHPPLPGTHLLDLLAESPDEPAAPAGPARDPITLALSGVAALFATIALGVAVMTWLSVSDLQTIVAVGGSNPTANGAGPTIPAGQEEVASAGAVAPMPGGTIPGGPIPGGQAPGGTVPDEQPAPPGAMIASYAPAYRPQTLQLGLPPCQSTMTRYVDLDEPRVDADASRADLYYKARTGCYGTPQLHLINGVLASVVARPSLRPAQCATTIRNAPADNPITLTDTTVLCVLTSADKAVGEDITQKLVMLVISAPTATGAATVRATAWHVTR